VGDQPLDRARRNSRQEDNAAICAPSIAVIIAAVFWTWLWGPIGLLLSTPITVCLLVLGRYVPQLQFLDVMLGSEPVLTSDETF
jgi:predicted PurR-regulated permease PerM